MVVFGYMDGFWYNYLPPLPDGFGCFYLVMAATPLSKSAASFGDNMSVAVLMRLSSLSTTSISSPARRLGSMLVTNLAKTLFPSFTYPTASSSISMRSCGRGKCLWSLFASVVWGIMKWSDALTAAISSVFSYMPRILFVALDFFITALSGISPPAPFPNWYSIMARTCAGLIFCGRCIRLSLSPS